MPNLPSAKKELRKSLRRRLRNSKIKHNLERLLKKGRKAISAQSAEAGQLVKQTLKALDKAAQKGVIKKNTGRRLKSRLQIRFNQVFKAIKK